MSRLRLLAGGWARPRIEFVTRDARINPASGPKGECDGECLVGAGRLALVASIISISVALIEIVIGAVAGNTIGLRLTEWVNFLAGFGAIRREIYRHCARITAGETPSQSHARRPIPDRGGPWIETLRIANKVRFAKA